MPPIPDPGPDTEAFVRARTVLRPVPLVPEVRLHQASGVVELWEGVEDRAGTAGEPPFWGFPWAGGQALARYLLDHPGAVEGRTVLDLASGSGLVAVAAALAGAATVVADDIDPLAVAAVRLNAAANGVHVRTSAEDLLDGDGAPADVVLAGDVFYSRAMAGRVLAFLDRAGSRGAAVLVGDPGRAYLPRDRLRLLAAYDVPVARELEDQEVKRSVVWALRPAPRP